MRTLHLLPILALCAMLTGCGGGSSNSSPGVTTTPYPSAPSQQTLVYTVGRNSSDIAAFPINGNGAVTPTILISGAATGITEPVALAVDNAGTVYTANDGGTTVLIFAAGANGNVTPGVISGPLTQIGPSEGVAVDHQGFIYVSSFTANSIVVFRPGTRGNIPPVRTIAGSATTLNNANVMAFDANNDLYIGENNGLVLEFSPTANGNVAPMTTISDPADIQSVGGLTIDGNGRILVGNICNPGGVAIFAAGATGNATPIQKITGTSVNCVGGVGVDSSNNIYVNNNTGTTNTLTVFASTANGLNPTPLSQITTTSAILNDGFGAAVH